MNVEYFCVFEFTLFILLFFYLMLKMPQKKKIRLCNNLLRKKCPYYQFSGPHFASFELNAKIYRVNLHIQSECSGILRTRTLFAQ